MTPNLCSGMPTKCGHIQKQNWKWRADMITADDGRKISRGATFSFAALCFLGTLTFPQASAVLYPHWLNWGSWVTLVEISISPQNKEPGSVPSVISTIHPALRFSSSHQIHSLWFLGELEGFKSFQLRTVRKRETTASVFVSTCSIFRVQLLSWGWAVNWPQYTTVCVAEWHNGEGKLWKKGPSM